MLLRSGYSDLDQTGEASKYALRLDAVAASPFWRDIRQRMAALLDLRPGDTVLDVGCGTGDDVRALAHVVGTNGRAVGIDKSADMIAEARRRSQGLPVAVEFQQGDVEALEFADGTFDACRVERVLQHVADPELAVKEMLRILRSGGRLAAVDPDYGTLAVAGADAGLTMKILEVRRQHFLSPLVGGELPRVFKQHGLRDLVVQLRPLGATSLNAAERLTLRKYADEAVTAGAISGDEAQRWLAELESAAAEGRYRFAVVVFVVRGRKL